MDDPLAIYLHDHLAGSSFAVELLEKLASEFSGTPSGEIARDLLVDIQADRKTLEQMISKVGEANTPVYDALGWIAERVSRLKLKHDDPTGIGAFEAFETISLGILLQAFSLAGSASSSARRHSDCVSRLCGSYSSGGATVSDGQPASPGACSRSTERAGG
jgi:hypothetical protein